jgi:hypothetical protein
VPSSPSASPSGRCQYRRSGPSGCRLAPRTRRRRLSVFIKARSGERGRLDRSGGKAVPLRCPAARVLRSGRQADLRGPRRHRHRQRRTRTAVAAAAAAHDHKMPLDVPPPRGARFGSPLVLSRVHWVRPELVAEVSSSSPGPRTICCAKSSTRGCGRTSPRERCGARWRAKSKFAGGAWRRDGPRPRLKYSVDYSHPANLSTICRMPLTVSLYS